MDRTGFVDARQVGGIIMADTTATRPGNVESVAARSCRGTIQTHRSDTTFRVHRLPHPTTQRARPGNTRDSTTLVSRLVFRMPIHPRRTRHPTTETIDHDNTPIMRELSEKYGAATPFDSGRISSTPRPRLVHGLLPHGAAHEKQAMPTMQPHDATARTCGTPIRLHHSRTRRWWNVPILLHNRTTTRQQRRQVQATRELC